MICIAVCMLCERVHDGGMLALIRCVLQVEKLHAEVVSQVKDLYYSHRHLHSWENRELEIV